VFANKKFRRLCSQEHSRNNWLFADTVNGANASAVLYSVIETAKENGLYPFDYLEFVFRTAPGLDYRNDPALLDQLMPWNAPLISGVLIRLPGLFPGM